MNNHSYPISLLQRRTTVKRQNLAKLYTLGAMAALSSVSYASEQMNHDTEFCLFAPANSTGDTTLTFNQLKKEAENGNAAAQVELGFCYQNGEGVAKDEKEAVNWFKSAAEKGNDKAQCVYALHCEIGHHVPKDEKEAFNWYKKSADQGYAPAQCKLAQYYQAGLGTTADLSKAIELYKKAALQGYPEAEYRLGEIGRAHV